MLNKPTVTTVGSLKLIPCIQRGGAAQKRRSAFTLVELVVVIMVLAILAVAAAPRYVDSLHRFRVEAAARRIAADLNYTRERAITRGAAVEEWVQFFPATEEYEMVGAADFDRPDMEYRVNLDDTPYPVNLVSSEFTNENGFTSNVLVKYNMYGQAVCGDAPILGQVSGQVIVASGDYQATVVIDPATGKASVQ